MKPRMSFEVAGGTEAFVAYVTLVWLFACVHQVVLLQVRKLREALRANITMKWPLA